MLPSENKSQFTKTISAVDDTTTCSREGMKYVIDGGMLVQRIPWKVGSTFTEISRTVPDRTGNLVGSYLGPISTLQSGVGR